MSAQEIPTFLPCFHQLIKVLNKNQAYLNLSGSAFLVIFTDPNSQLFNENQYSNFLTEDLVRKKHIHLFLF